MTQPEKQFSNKVGELSKVRVVSKFRLENAFAAILVIPKLTVIDVIVVSSVELTAEPIVNILVPASLDGIVIALTVEPVIFVMPVSSLTFEILKIKSYPAANKSESVYPATFNCEILKPACIC